MSKKLQLGLDTSDFQKSLFDITQMIERSFNKGKSVDLFSKDTKDLLTKEAVKSIAQIGKEMDKLVSRTAKYHEVLEKGNLTEEKTIRAKQRILALESERVKKAKELVTFQTARGALSGEGGGGGEGGLGVAASAGIGGAVGGFIGAIATKVLKRFMEPYNAFASSVPQRMGLMGRGINDVSGGNDYLTNGLGYKPNEVRSAQEQGIGIFGLNASQTDSKELAMRMRFSRTTGMGVDQLQGGFQGVQAQGGFGQANRTFEEFRATIFSNKLEHALAPYFEAMQGVLAQINEDGLGLNSDAMQAIANISGNGQNVSAQEAAKLTMSLDQYIKGASGDVQALMMQAYADKGIGGNTLGGAQAGLQYGLFGGGTKAQLNGYVQGGLLKGHDVDMIMKLGFGGEGASRKRAGAYYDKLTSLISPYGAKPGASEKDQEESWNQQSMILQKATGAKDDTEARMRYNSLGMLANGQKTAKDVQGMWEADDPTKIMKSSEGYLASIDAKMSRNLEVLGKGISDPINEIRSIIANLLGGAAGVAKTVGNVWNGATNWGGVNIDPLKGFEQLTNGSTWSSIGGFAKDQMFGSGPMSQDQSDIMSGNMNSQDLASMSPERRAKLLGDARGELGGLRGQEEDARNNGESTWMFEGKEESIQKLIELLTQLNKTSESQLKAQEGTHTQVKKIAGPKADGAGSQKTKR